jgi:hypothetical protein
MRICYYSERESIHKRQKDSSGWSRGGDNIKYGLSRLSQNNGRDMPTKSK